MSGKERGAPRHGGGNDGGPPPRRAVWSRQGSSRRAQGSLGHPAV